MNTEFNTTEELLKKGKQITLSVSERDEMKSQLLSYATFHAPKEIQKEEKSSSKLFHTSVWFRSASASALALFLFVGTGYASTDSLPGEPLYAVKVHVVEELLSVVLLNEEKQLSFKLSQLEERLGEIHTLTERNLLTAKLLEESQENFEDHIVDINKIINKSTSTLTDVAALEVTSGVVSITRAAGKLIEDEMSDESVDAFDAVVTSAVDVYSNELKSFIAEGDSADMQAYIESQLEEIAGEVAENDLASTTTDLINENLFDIQEALSSNNVSNATSLVSETALNVHTEEYTFDFQDEVDER